MATKSTKTQPKATARKATSAGPRRKTTKAPRAPAVTPVVEKAQPEAARVSEPIPVAPPSPQDTSGQSDNRLKRPDLIEAIAARVSIKRSEVKEVMDVMLDELGKAVDAADEVVVPPLGKFMIKKRIEKPGGPLLTVKLKRAAPQVQNTVSAPLADPDEEG